LKKLLTFTSVLLSFNSFALIERAPQISFNAGEATTFVSVLDTCIDGDTFKTIIEKEIFAHIRSGKSDKLVVVGNEILSRPRTYVTTISSGKDGRFEKEITVTLPLDYTIEYLSNAHGDNDAQVVYKKSFIVPTCE